MNERTMRLQHLPRSLSWMARIITGLLFALPLLYLPGFGSYGMLRYLIFGTCSLIIGWFAIYEILRRPELMQALYRSFLMRALVIFVAILAITGLVGQSPARSYFSSMQRTDGVFSYIFLLLFTLGVIICIRVGGTIMLQRFLKASVCGAVGLSVIIMFAPGGFNFLLPQTLMQSRGGGTIGNSSLAALVIVWNMFFAGYLFALSRKTRQRFLWGVSLCVMAISPLFINWRLFLGQESFLSILSLLGTARAGVLSLLLGALMAFGIWLTRTEAKKRYGIALIVGIALIFLLSAFLVAVPHSAVHRQFNDLTYGARTIFWQAAWSGFIERPLLGFGPGGFSNVYHRHFNPDILSEKSTGEVFVDRTHNIFFETLISGGLVLLVALLGLMFFGVRALKSFLRRDWLFGSMLGGGALAWFIQAQFIFDSLCSLVILFFILAILIGYNEEVARDSVIRFNGRHRVFCIFFLVILGLLFWYAIALPFQKARALSRIYDMPLPDRIAQWEKLSGISPMGDDYDSALMFMKVLRAYEMSIQTIRSGDAILRIAATEELRVIGDYIDTLLKNQENYELLLLSAQLGLVHARIAEQVTPEDITRIKQLSQRAARFSPSDPRPREILTILKADTE